MRDTAVISNIFSTLLCTRLKQHDMEKKKTVDKIKREKKNPLKLNKIRN